MTSYTSLAAGIVDAIDGISNIGVVHGYPRYSSESWAAYLDLFKATISGVSVIRGWQVGRESIERSVDGVFGREWRIHRMFVQGVMGVYDSGNSYGDFQSLIDTVMATIDSQATMGVAGVMVDAIGPCVVQEIGEEWFGDVLCHTCHISVPIISILDPGVA